MAFGVVSLLNPAVVVNSNVITVFAGTEAVTGGALSFVDSNGVTFGLHNNTITASVGAAGGYYGIAGGAANSVDTL